MRSERVLGLGSLKRWHSGGVKGRGGEADAHVLGAPPAWSTGYGPTGTAPTGEPGSESKPTWPIRGGKGGSASQKHPLHFAIPNVDTGVNAKVLWYSK